jgi:hypothetical protein
MRWGVPSFKRQSAPCTATATYNCLDYASDRDLNAAQKAMLCKGTQYAILTATLNCFDQAVETMSADAAARLCHRAVRQPR